MNEAKRFEDWEEVDCNTCDHYWNSTCDSDRKGVKRHCNSYLATRKVFIPEELKRLKLTLKTLILLGVAIVAWLVVITVGIILMIFR